MLNSSSLFVQLALTNCFCYKLVLELIPKLIEVCLVLLDENRVMKYDQVLLVGANCLTSPVEAAAHQDLAVNQTVLVVHVGFDVVVCGAGHACHSKPPDVCPIEFAALVVRDDSDFYAFSVHVGKRFGKNIVCKGEHAAIYSFLSSSDNLGEVFNVLVTREKH